MVVVMGELQAMPGNDNSKRSIMGMLVVRGAVIDGGTCNICLRNIFSMSLILRICSNHSLNIRGTSMSITLLDYVITKHRERLISIF